jgi:hypothetical protein
MSQVCIMASSVLLIVLPPMTTLGEALLHSNSARGSYGRLRQWLRSAARGCGLVSYAMIGSAGIRRRGAGPPGIVEL